MRRKVVEVFLHARKMERPISPQAAMNKVERSKSLKVERSKRQKVQKAEGCLQTSYRANIANREAERFYCDLGAEKVEPAFELKPPAHAVLMTCRHCLRYSLGVCPKHQRKRAGFKEPLVLVSADGRRFPLRFDCKNCVMEVLS